MTRNTLRRVRLGDIKGAYMHMSTPKLMKSLVVLRMCKSTWLLSNALPLLSMASKVFGEFLAYHTVVKWTMYSHFCAGEDERGVKKTLTLLGKLNVGSILDYAAEADVPIVKHDKPPDVSMRSLSTQTKLTYAADEDVYDENMKLYVLCVAHASLNIWQYGIGYAAVKLTGIMDPQLLARVSAVLLYMRQQWIRFFVSEDDVPPLEECRVVFGPHMPDKRLVATHDVVRAGLKKWANNQLTDAQLQSIIDWLDHDNSGSVEYLEFTRMLGSCLDRDDRGFAILRPLMEHCPQLRLTDDELRMWSNAKRRIRTICQVAAELKVHVMIDAEQTFYQMAIDHVVRNLQREFNREAPIVFNTYQCYLKIMPYRIRNDLARAKREGWVWAGKLVRGAYVLQERNTAAEYNYISPIFETKEETDECFNACSVEILDEIQAEPNSNLGVLFGTHNVKSLELITNRIIDRKIKAHNISFAQLFGMADNLTIPLARAGFNTFKYVPYGPVRETIQYLSRRAQENSAIMQSDTAEDIMMWRELRRRLKLGS